MMMQWASKISGEVLHMAGKAADVSPGRTDLVPADQFIQCSALRMGEGATFRPHKHIHCLKETTIAQESWVVIQGRVRVTFYDLDDTVLGEHILGPGDISITLRGGHNYLSLEQDTVVYEFKTGPYLGQAKDKVFIDRRAD